MDQATIDKLCKKCGVVKIVCEFSRNKNRKDGLAYYCKACSSKLTMLTRDREKYKNYQDSHRHMAHLSSIRNRAKCRGLPFDLTLEDLAEIPDVCPVLGIPLLRNLGTGFQSDNSPTVDRIVPDLGYVKGNTIIVSSLANRIKQNATPDQIKKVAQFYERLSTEFASTANFPENV